MGRVPPGAVCETCRPVARVTVYAGEIVMSARDVQSMGRELLAKLDGS